VSTARQQRDAARAKLETRMAEKAARARRNRRIQVSVASVVAVALVIGLGVFFYKVISNAVSEDSADKGSESKEDMVPAGDGAPVDDVKVESLSMSKAADASAGTATCEYPGVPKEQLEQNPNITDVGTPGDGKKPNTGTQEMTIKLGQGSVKVDIDNEKAPCTAASFSFLAGEKFFNDSTCHRLVTEGIFVLQCGDPSGTGQGGPTYSFANEYEPKDTAKGLSEEDMQAGKAKPNYEAGVIAMANSGPDTNGSQFFIVYEDSYLPPDYTIFGTVTKGLDVVREIAKAGAEVPASQQQQQMPVG
jgi:peptidyl-prolyl cis-trans isomerase B (cyclophilin B)